MLWLLRMGLGSHRVGLEPDLGADVPVRGVLVMSWEEIVLSADIEMRRLQDLRERLADSMLQAAIHWSKRIDPLLTSMGGRFEAAFTSLVRSHCFYEFGGHKQETRLAPTQLQVDNQGVAIAAARAAVAAGIATMRAQIDSGALVQFHQEHRVPWPPVKVAAAAG